MPSDDPRPATLTPARICVEGHQRLPLDGAWEAASCGPDSHSNPASIDGLTWLPASVPGTAASTLQAAGRWRPGEPIDLDAEDWWFRTRFDLESPLIDGEEILLRLDGIATLAEVYLNGMLVLESESMFAQHALHVGQLLRAQGNDLVIRCRALAPQLRIRRKPRARWRTRLVDGGLRFFRTMLLGRAPGFAPGPAAVGPWRPVWLEHRRGLVVEALELRTHLDGEDGVLKVRAVLRGLDGDSIERAEAEVRGASGTHRAPILLEKEAEGVGASAELVVPNVARWWPHTHGDPVLHEVRLHLETSSKTIAVEAGQVGFRQLSAGTKPGHDPLVDGLDLHVNGVRVFARGAVWTPVDVVGLAPGEKQLRAALQCARDGGMNILRIPGTGAYESPAFHDLCDQLGILVWQDFMFANLDYPIAQDDFRAAVEAEARAVLGEIGGRPSLAVLCGNSEIEQQVAMLGLDPDLGRGELFGELLPRLVEEAGIDATYLPSAPCGGDLPFRCDRGVANYYGVGGYRRPLEDVRRAGVRFAAECLAFSNVPDESGVEAIMPEAPGDVVTHHPRWKAGVPRDAGTGWDFDDVRDHYLELLFGIDSEELRRYDHDRYLELSRAVSGEVMAAVFGEWRRNASPCGGALVLWMRDLAPGAGWGIIDHLGSQKCAYHHLRRALAPTAVWMTDEGLGGVGVHLANDSAEPLSAQLRLALYRDFEKAVSERCEEVRLEPHDVQELDLESLLGGFADASWAYRFGPPAQDLIVASLERDSVLLSQSIFMPAGRPTESESPERLGIEASARRKSDQTLELSVRGRRFLYGMRVLAPGFTPSDDAFSVEPGVERTLALRAFEEGTEPKSIGLTALNMRGRIAVSVD